MPAPKKIIQLNKKKYKEKKFKNYSLSSLNERDYTFTNCIFINSDIKQLPIKETILFSECVFLSFDFELLYPETEVILDNCKLIDCDGLNLLPHIQSSNSHICSTQKPQTFFHPHESVRDLENEHQWITLAGKPKWMTHPHIAQSKLFLAGILGYSIFCSACEIWPQHTVSQWAFQLDQSIDNNPALIFYLSLGCILLSLTHQYFKKNKSHLIIQHPDLNHLANCLNPTKLICLLSASPITRFIFTQLTPYLSINYISTIALISLFQLLNAYFKLKFIQYFAQTQNSQFIDMLTSSPLSIFSFGTALTQTLVFSATHPSASTILKTLPVFTYFGSNFYVFNSQQKSENSTQNNHLLTSLLFSTVLVATAFSLNLVFLQFGSFQPEQLMIFLPFSMLLFANTLPQFKQAIDSRDINKILMGLAHMGLIIGNIAITAYFDEAYMISHTTPHTALPAPNSAPNPFYQHLITQSAEQTAPYFLHRLPV